MWCGHLMGKHLPRRRFHSSEVIITFISDSLLTFGGFSLQYQILVPGMENGKLLNIVILSLGYM